MSQFLETCTIESFLIIWYEIDVKTLKHLLEWQTENLIKIINPGNLDKTGSGKLLSKITAAIHIDTKNKAMVTLDFLIYGISRLNVLLWT